MYIFGKVFFDSRKKFIAIFIKIKMKLNWFFVCCEFSKFLSTIKLYELII